MQPTGFLARRADELVADPPSSVAVHATDIDRAWTIRMASDGLHVTTTGQADVPSLTGTASDLYLYVWNRIGADRLTAHGDQEVWTVWRATAIVT
ncbi:MAG TPA: hypothetical protein VN408_27700 [Actinoplanes sp.]|nr:hypothetical protein [Actinoplanes sp.]